jgi:hypothetical protein
MIKRRRKFYANFSYAPSVSCPIIRGHSGGRGSDWIVAEITGKRKPKFFGGWRVQDLLENSRPCGAVVGLRAEPRSWSWLNDRRAELKVPQSYNKTEMALGLLLKWNRLTWKLGDMAYNSSETEKMMWHVYMLRKLLLVGCSNIDIIDVPFKFFTCFFQILYISNYLAKGMYTARRLLGRLVEKRSVR